MTEYLRLDNAVVYSGDCLEELKNLPDNSIDSIVTDPPYGLGNSDPNYIIGALKLWMDGDRSHIPAGKGFMGKQWDAFVPPPAVWDECLRVLKPGGHMLVFAGTRTQDLMGLSVRMAGFEIRDSIGWIYGQGFPKSMDVSKAIDKVAGAEEDAKKWAGWGTALKPALEPIIVARKPLSEKSITANVLKWGVGGLNIDATRIGTETMGGGTMPNLRDVGAMSKEATGIDKLSFGQNPRPATRLEQPTTTGRFPSNIIFGHTEKCVLVGSVQESYAINKTENWTGFGQTERPDYVGSEQSVGVEIWKCVEGCPVAELEKQTVGTSKFFYQAKANKKDRNEGLEGLPEKGKVFNGKSEESAGNAPGSVEDKFTTKPQTNFHPTVKPTSLMEYLIKLVTPAGGVVLDPFTGSGSAGKAALLNGFKFVGVELTEDYLPIIEGRLKFAQKEMDKKIVS